MLQRIVVPKRLAIITRKDESLAYNPEINTWERLQEDTAAALRWLRAGRERQGLASYLHDRFGYAAEQAEQRLTEILKWSLVRQLLFLDKEPEAAAYVRPERPLATVYWVCTQGCNLRCTYCYQEALVARPNELTTEEGFMLIDQAVEAGARTFVFTGGEPFTRRDLLDLARYCKSKGLRTNVITNGQFITAKNVQEVASIFDHMTISLDHGKAEHHDRHRGLGSWQRTVRAIELLLETGGPTLDINSVLSRQGLREIKELLRFARERKIVRHKIVPQFPMGRGAVNRNSEVGPDDLITVVDKLYHANAELTGEGESHLVTEGKTTGKRVRRHHCGAGLSEVSVDPEGWVYPCRLLQHDEFRGENIRERRLVEIFNCNPTLQTIQGTIVEKLPTCRTCIIRNQCGGGCRGIQYAFTQKYTQVSPMYCSYLRHAFEVQAWASTGEVPPERKLHFHESDAIPASAAASHDTREERV